jgi:NADH-quinone oxidoreductase subunit L
VTGAFWREHAWLIPLLPAAGFLWNGVAGHRLPRRLVGLVACGTVLGALLLSLGVIAEVARHPGESFEVAFPWIAGFDLTTALGERTRLDAPWGFLVDPLTAVMLFVVCFVGFFIHVYSTGYMAHEQGYARFFAYLNLFMAMMLTLVLANNLLMMFVGWEGVGLCSYLLIGFYYQRRSAADAGKKAFVVNRIGDFGMVLGILFCLYLFGSVRFTDLVPTAQAMAADGLVGASTITLVCLLFFLGATGKSAQIPLYVWLPDAMEGPTPVSALIHAATMVTSGVYLIARLNGLFSLSAEAMAVVAVVGCLTALWAATIALTQTDIKRVLAYSTVSQLGYMFLALGLGAYAAAVFHLMTHAFFKACLFLGSGSVIHALGGEQDMRRMGGLKRHLPHTYRTFWLATVAIAGIFPLAGFFSKDEILWNAFGYGRYGLWLLGFLTAGLTGFYMFRLVHRTFDQSEHLDDHARAHLHESPPSMTVPLWVLATGSVVAGWVGWPEALGGGNHWHHWLAPVIGEVPGRVARHGHGVEALMAAVSVAWALGAIVLARRVYFRDSDLAERLARRLGPLYRGSLHKWYVDEIYDGLVVNPVKKLTAVADLFDRWVVDGLVNLTRHGTVAVAVVSRVFDLRVIDLLVNLVGWTTQGLGALFRRLQTGRLQSYAYYFVVGVFLMVCFFLLARGGGV